MSHVDTFDYKPELVRLHGKSLSTDEKPDVFFGQVGLLRAPDWQFRQRGQSGLWVSDLLPHIAEVADELTVINSMFAETSNHTPAMFQENTGFRLNGFPVLGSWLSYGLGCETDNLPAFVVIPDARELPAGGSINWTNGFLPARHQGVVVRTRGNPIDDLFPPASISADGRTRDARSVGFDERAASVRASAGRSVGRARASVRDGGANAVGRARGGRSEQRDRIDANDVRFRPGRDHGLRPRRA